jgi:uncharacterized membrane protein YeaQ/YmgE (transglycosylase-associated protein family)
MFSNLLVGAVMGIGVAGWVFAKTQKHNGGQTQQSLLVAAIVGLITVLVATTLLSMFL